MKNIIFHFPTIINMEDISGTMIRPLRMKEAFENIGYNVCFINGYSSNRARKISEVKQLIENNYKFEFLYSESVNCPTILSDSDHLPKHPFLDFCFFSYIKRKHIPIGLFYRDIYWKFKTYKKEVNLLKKIISIPLFYYDLIQYKRLVDVLFVPSNSLISYLPSFFNNSNLFLLPPGCIIKNNNYYNSEKKSFTILYIGNVALPEYDINIIFKIANNLLDSQIKFIISCPKDSWNKWSNYYLQQSNGQLPKNIYIDHRSPENTYDLYCNADLFIIPIKDDYSRITSPMKLYETIGYGIPSIIIVSGKSEASKFINENNIGWIINYSVEEVVKLIKYLYNNKKEIENKKLKIIEIQDKHTWNARAKYVSETLLSYKQ